MKRTALIGSRLHQIFWMSACWISFFPAVTEAQKTGRPYRLESVSPKQRIIWGAECRLPDGRGLAFYTLTLVATPKGALCWDQNARIHRFDSCAMCWTELEWTDDRLPGAVSSRPVLWNSIRSEEEVDLGYGHKQPGLRAPPRSKEGRVEKIF